MSRRSVKFAAQLGAYPQAKPLISRKSEILPVAKRKKEPKTELYKTKLNCGMKIKNNIDSNLWLPVFFEYLIAKMQTSITAEM